MTDEQTVEESLLAIAEAIREAGTTVQVYSPIDDDEPANCADGLFAIAAALKLVAHAIHKLGLADASTPMGAIEAHGIIMRNAAETIASAIAELKD